MVNLAHTTILKTVSPSVFAGVLLGISRVFGYYSRRPAWIA